MEKEMLGKDMLKQEDLKKDEIKKEKQKVKTGRKYYRLTGSQMMHYNMIRDYGTQKTSNVSTCAALQADLDFDLLSECIREEYTRADFLRIRFTQPDELGNILQYEEDAGVYTCQDIRLYDLTDMTLKEADDLMQQWAYDTFDAPDSAMCEFRLIELAEGFRGFFLHIDHRLADSCALNVLIGDIMQNYCHKAFGGPEPDALSSYMDMLEKDISKANNPKRFSKDVDFWKQELMDKGEPIYSDLKGTCILEESRRKHNDKKLRAADVEQENLNVLVKDFVLDADATAEVLNYCQREEISVNNVLLMGIRTVLSECCDGQEDISVRSFISRRAARNEWTCGGSRTVAFPCRTVFGSDISFTEGAREIQHLQNNIYLHSNYDTALLDRQIQDMYPHPDMTTYESVWLTYQPMPVKLDNPYLKGIRFHVKWFPNGAASKKLYLTVTHTPDGGMNFSFHYQEAVYDEGDMDFFYNRMKKVILEGIRGNVVCEAV